MKKTFKAALLLLSFYLQSTTGFSQFNRFDRMGYDARGVAEMNNHYRDGRDHGRKMRGFLGYEVGAFFSFADFNYQHVFDDVGGFHGGRQITIDRTLKSRHLGFNAGSYVLLGSLGESSALAFDWGITAVFSASSTGDVTMPSGNVYAYSFNYLQFAVPLLLSYKWGGEAVYDKSQPFSFTAGAGLYPAFVTTTLGSSGNTKGLFAPVLKAEIGFFAGLQWKIKANYIAYTSGEVYKARVDDPGMEGAPQGSVYTVASSAPFNIGIAIMPFSIDWEKSRW